MKILQKVLDVSNKQDYLSDAAVAKIKNEKMAVILRIGYTGYGNPQTPTYDKKFEANYAKLKAAGVPVGVYYFTICYNDEITNKEINFLKKALEGKTFEYPVYIDVEPYEDKKACPAWNNCPKATRTQNVSRICEALEKEGYYVGIYFSKGLVSGLLDLTKLTRFDKWIAQYNIACTYSGAYGLWQYSSKEPANKYYIVHAENRVDISNAYYDFPKIIKEQGLNNYAKRKYVTCPKCGERIYLD